MISINIVISILIIMLFDFNIRRLTQSKAKSKGIHIDKLNIKNRFIRTEMYTFDITNKSSLCEIL